MISSIVLTGCYDIGVNASGNIKLDGHIFSPEKDIPFIRYRFENWGEEQYNYVKAMQQKFKNVTHLAEVILDVNSYNVVSKLKEIDNLAVYVYMTITDDVVANSAFDEASVSNLGSLNGLGVDRVCLKDKSTTLDTVAATKIINQLSKVIRMGAKTGADDFAICGSPLSFDGCACLTAVKARELMSKYNASSDVALPSANHQCMNNCGCIRYIVVSDNVPAPADAHVKKEKADTNKVAKEPKVKDEKEPKEKKTKPKKAVYIPGMYKL